jgi:hypothetical protein
MIRSISRIHGIWLCTTYLCLAAPEPAIVQGPNQWTAHIRFEPLRQMTLSTPLQLEPSRFWYTILSIENDTGSDIDYYPQADLLTDTLQLVPAGKAVPPEVFPLIKARHTGTFPFLEDLPITGTRILQGHDHARDFIVIWPDFDIMTHAVSLFFAGLSNETAVIDHPIAREQTGRPTKVFLKKTLQLDFSLWGASNLRRDEDIQFVASHWIMR